MVAALQPSDSRVRERLGEHANLSEGHGLIVPALIEIERRRADQCMFEDYLLAIDQVETRLKALEAQIEVVSREPRYAEAVGALRCFRGIDTITAMSIVAGLHDMMRFDSPRGLMAYLGLVSSEHSSGGKEHREEITKAGNSHVRRLLIEAAWHYRHRPGLKVLAKRREGQPKRVIAIADRAMHRLHRRFNRMLERARNGRR